MVHRSIFFTYRIKHNTLNELNQISLSSSGTIFQVSHAPVNRDFHMPVIVLVTLLEGLNLQRNIEPLKFKLYDWIYRHTYISKNLWNIFKLTILLQLLRQYAYLHHRAVDQHRHFPSENSSKIECFLLVKFITIKYTIKIIMITVK